MRITALFLVALLGTATAAPGRCTVSAALSRPLVHASCPPAQPPRPPPLPHAYPSHTHAPLCCSEGIAERLGERVAAAVARGTVAPKNRYRWNALLRQSVGGMKGGERARHRWGWKAWQAGAGLVGRERALWPARRLPHPAAACVPCRPHMWRCADLAERHPHRRQLHPDRVGPARRRLPVPAGAHAGSTAGWVWAPLQAACAGAAGCSPCVTPPTAPPPGLALLRRWTLTPTPSARWTAAPNSARRWPC